MEYDLYIFKKNKETSKIISRNVCNVYIMSEKGNIEVCVIKSGSCIIK